MVRARPHPVLVLRPPDLQHLLLMVLWLRLMAHRDGGWATDLHHLLNLLFHLHDRVHHCHFSCRSLLLVSHQVLMDHLELVFEGLVLLNKAIAVRGYVLVGL